MAPKRHPIRRRQLPATIKIRIAMLVARGGIDGGGADGGGEGGGGGDGGGGDGGGGEGGAPQVT